MKQYSVRNNDVHYISKEIYSLIKNYTISKDDLYITVAGTIGVVGEIPIEFDGANLTENANKIVFTQLNKKCLMYLLSSDYVQTQIKNCTTKVGQPKLAIIRIQNFLLPIPPLAEQQRIVEKIEELIPHIELYGKAQTELDTLNRNIKEQLKKSVLQYAIEGKLVPQDEAEGTAEELLLQIQKEKQKLYEEGKLKKKDLVHSIIFKGEDNKYYEKIGKNVTCIDEEIPFEIPKNWRWCRVSNISQSYIGLTYRPEEIKKEGVIVLRSSNIKDGKTVLQDIVRVSKEIPDKLLVKENDIIICARNGSQKLVGKSALIEKIVEPTTFGAFMAICKTPFYKYMYLFLQSNCFFSQLKNVSGTTTINQLTQSSLNNFLIPLPPLAEQQRIVESIDAIFRCIEN